jgi:hypothetical protein
MTLRDLKYNYIYYVLLKNSYNRSVSARELGISDRGMRNYIQDMKRLGFETDKPKKENKKEELNEYAVSTYVMPDNEERLKYIDWLINANYMKKAPARVSSNV